MLYLLLLLALIQSSVGGTCDCSTFMVLGDEVNEIYRFPTVQIDTCDGYIVCHRECVSQFIEFTNGGNLNHFLESGHASGQTVGQLFCGHLATKRQPYQAPTFVYLYMSVCEKSWEYTETTTRSQLCCIAGLFSKCDMVPGFKLHSSPPLKHARPVEITVNVAGM